MRAENTSTGATSPANIRDMWRVTLMGILVAGCMQAVSSPVGSNLWSVECKRNRANCYREADRRCPHGFDIVDSEGGIKGGMVMATSPNTAFFVPAYRGEMLVRCNGEPSPEPKPGVVVAVPDPAVSTPPVPESASEAKPAPVVAPAPNAQPAAAEENPRDPYALAAPSAGPGTTPAPTPAAPSPRRHAPLLLRHKRQ